MYNIENLFAALYCFFQNIYTPVQNDTIWFWHAICLIPVLLKTPKISQFHFSTPEFLTIQIPIPIPTLKNKSIQLRNSIPTLVPGNSIP